ncbi:isocitrate lyase/phosphoenolpyruvate mutase family protein [Salicibibacter cibarius]|uniref:Isocitrate lyase/phosphoenolpyruvate mutase family protein n=1 Tax=Salicibibacter cibarius TaxID=2743000 RepID=A0A7T6Z283_9BACI|nr:isocitrate lyase/phosphoenolpyruvate mutase family protein [Salicibibacter cibarius]QQK75502.1 isocitrate lyase/phosphoenolpyruvate mutase family protein [Salicibibacter cibarius]
MHWEEIEQRRKQANEDFSAGEIPLIPSAHDPLSAQAVEDKGFRMAFLSSDDVSKLYGYASSYTLSATEMIASVRSITQVSALALLVQLPLDARSCQQIIKQVYELRQLGIRMIQIDDEINSSTQELTQIIVQMKHYFPEVKIVMAIRANASITGIEAAVTKANKLLHAGADFILYQGLYTEGEYLYTSQYTNGPLLALLNKDNNQDLSYSALKNMGYHATVLQEGHIHRMKKIYAEAYKDT